MGNSMENEHLKVTINEDGTFNVVEKESGSAYSDLHYFTDTGDNGDPWVRFVPDHNRLYSTRGLKADIQRIESSHLAESYQIDYNFIIPKGLEKSDYIMEGYYNNTRSSSELVPLKIRSVLTLSKGASSLDIQTEIDNRSTDHLVQVVFPTGLKTEKVFAESGFDVVERKIVTNERNLDPGLVNGEDPFLRFVDVADSTKGLSIVSDSVKGYEVLGDNENSLALNLIRAYTSQIVTIYGRKERRPDQGLTQAQGIQKFHYSVYPHTGTWENGCLEEAEKLNYPLVPVQTHRSFGKLPSELSFLKIGSRNIVISALKKANREDAVIVRVFNPSAQSVETEIQWMKKIRGLESVNLNEETIHSEDSPLVDGNKFKVHIGAKKIATYKVKF
jgi:mannosylglycerate hydrolase